MTLTIELPEAVAAALRADAETQNKDTAVLAAEAVRHRYAEAADAPAESPVTAGQDLQDLYDLLPPLLASFAGAAEDDMTTVNSRENGEVQSEPSTLKAKIEDDIRAKQQRQGGGAC